MKGVVYISCNNLDNWIEQRRKHAADSHLNKAEGKFNVKDCLFDHFTDTYEDVYTEYHLIRLDHGNDIDSAIRQTQGLGYEKFIFMDYEDISGNVLNTLMSSLVLYV